MLIEDKHFEYLVLQNGSIDKFKDSRVVWRKAYEDRLSEIAINVSPWLPKDRPYSILDIGSGLGGIHIKLKELNPQVKVSLLDGAFDPPEMKAHAVTFNSMYVTEDFLNKNGVDIEEYCPPSRWPKDQYDIILSLQSWCFHYNPELYIDMVRACIKPEGRIIVDMRIDYKTWQYVMQEAFGTPTVIREDRKFIRCVYFIK